MPLNKIQTVGYKMIAIISPQHFFKCQRSIEHRNLKDPSKKILVMDRGITSPTSHISGLLLKAYYSKLEKNPKLGLSDLDFNFLIKNHTNNQNEIECFYCKTHVAAKEITIDHFKPRVFNGANQYFNIRLSCKDCNASKGGIYPQRMPVTFNLFLSKVQESTKIQCLYILLEAKEQLIDKMDEVEIRIMNRLILMEMKWRNDYKEKKEAKQIEEVA